jgi:hypothetical protein
METLFTTGSVGVRGERDQGRSEYVTVDLAFRRSLGQAYDDQMAKWMPGAFLLDSPTNCKINSYYIKIRLARDKEPRWRVLRVRVRVSCRTYARMDEWAERERERGRGQ